MFDDLGISFAPTNENALEAGRRNALEGLPQAIQLLSMRLPRVRGQGISPLVGNQGARGMDPYLSAVMQTLAKVFTGLPSESMGPGTTAGPIPPGFPNGPDMPLPPPRIIPIEPPAKPTSPAPMRPPFGGGTSGYKRYGDKFA